MILENMMRGPKDSKCMKCGTAIPKCAYNVGGVCSLPDEDDIGVESCLAETEGLHCPLVLCFRCRLDLNRQAQLLERMHEVSRQEAAKHLLRPYKRQFIYDGKDINCSMPELPGCFTCCTNTDVFSIAVADKQLTEAATNWLAALIESEEPIPAPEEEL